MRGGAGGPVTRPTRPLAPRTAMTPASVVSTSTIATSPQIRTRRAAVRSERIIVESYYRRGAIPYFRSTARTLSSGIAVDRAASAVTEVAMNIEL